MYHKMEAKKFNNFLAIICFLLVNAKLYPWAQYNNKEQKRLRI